MTVKNDVSAFFYREVFWDTIGAEILTVEAQNQETEDNKQTLHYEQ